jgi:hypothetical protein
LTEGNTIQLAYTVPAESRHYGVIFSIDGRSVVTMHYPYRLGQSSLMVSGRRTLLREAYTLDDAPYFEIFVMVISEKPLNTETILERAQEFAALLPTTENMNVSELSDAASIFIEEKSKAAFENCHVEIVTMLKS